MSALVPSHSGPSGADATLARLLCETTVGAVEANPSTWVARPHGDHEVRIALLAGGLCSVEADLLLPPGEDWEGVTRTLLRLSERIPGVKVYLPAERAPGEIVLASETPLKLLDPAILEAQVRGVGGLTAPRDRLCDAWSWLDHVGEFRAALRIGAGETSGHRHRPELIPADQQPSLALPAPNGAAHAVSASWRDGWVRLTRPVADAWPCRRYGELLEANRVAEVWRFVLDPDDGLALVYEVPRLGEDVLEHAARELHAALRSIRVRGVSVGGA